MSMPRVDLYGVIHKTLRHELFSTSRTLATTDFSNPADRDAAAAQLRETLGFIDEHGHHEERFVDQAVRQADPALADRIGAQHEDLDEQGRRLSAMLDEVVSAGPEQAVGLGATLHQAYSAYLGAYLQHMSMEEAEANACLWSAYSDEELGAIRGRLQGSIPPERFAQWFVLMVPAMNLQERVGVLSGMKLVVPPEVYETMCTLARSSLSDHAWQEVSSRLGAS